MFELEMRFTETYKKYSSSDHVAIREARCLEVQYPEMLDQLKSEDYFVGRLKFPTVYFSPQAGDPWDVFLYHCEFGKLEEQLRDGMLDDESKKNANFLIEFWKKENTKAKVIERFPEEMARVLGRNVYNTPAIGLAGYRIAGAYLDYPKLVKLGIPGLRKEIEYTRELAQSKRKGVVLFDAMLIALDVLVNCCKHYENIIGDLIKEDTKNKKLELLYNSIRNIAIKAPSNIHEAIQLSWIYSIVSGATNYGRMDVYLGDFMMADIEQGVFFEEEILEMLKSLWGLMIDRKIHFNNRVIVGGKDRPNEINADRFALLAMEATRQVVDVMPQLTLRFYQGMNPEVMKKAYDVIGEGRTFPMLLNDDVNIPAVAKAFDISLEMAENYVPFGCGEIVIDQKSIGTPSGGGNLLQALNVTLFDGKDPLTGEQMGTKLGTLEDFATFEELFKAYKKQMEYTLDINADMQYLEYVVANENASCLFYSILYDGCIEKGKAVLDGGVLHLGGTYEAHGVTNTADSLMALKKLVYDEKVISKTTILSAIKANFVGFEKERQMLLDCHKYGNDIKEADEMLAKVNEHLCNYVRNQRDRLPLDSYLVVNINNDHNTRLGFTTAASTDGRLQGEPLANANNPAPGMDKSGVTAFLNSLATIDPSIHAGYVQNMKFSKEWFSKSRNKLELLLNTYFKKGGTQAMITVLNRDDLENALKEPEKYRNLIVRVGGFSARFVELENNVQQEIMARTLY